MSDLPTPTRPEAADDARLLLEQIVPASDGARKRVSLALLRALLAREANR